MLITAFPDIWPQLPWFSSLSQSTVGRGGTSGMKSGARHGCYVVAAAGLGCGSIWECPVGRSASQPTIGQTGDSGCGQPLGQLSRSNGGLGGSEGGLPPVRLCGGDLCRYCLATLAADPRQLLGPLLDSRRHHRDRLPSEATDSGLGAGWQRPWPRIFVALRADGGRRQRQAVRLGRAIDLLSQVGRQKGNADATPETRPGIGHLGTVDRTDRFAASRGGVDSRDGPGRGRLRESVALPKAPGGMDRSGQESEPQGCHAERRRKRIARLFGGAAGRRALCPGVAGAAGASGARGSIGSPLGPTAHAATAAEESRSESRTADSDPSVGRRGARDEPACGRRADSLGVVHFGVGADAAGGPRHRGRLRETLADRRMAQGLENGLPGAEAATGNRQALGGRGRTDERRSRAVVATEGGRQDSTRPSRRRVCASSLRGGLADGAQAEAEHRRHGAVERPPLLPRVGRSRRLPGPQRRWRARLDYALARLGKTALDAPRRRLPCAPSGARVKNVGNDKAYAPGYMLSPPSGLPERGLASSLRSPRLFSAPLGQGGRGGEPCRIDARQGDAGSLADPSVTVALRRLERGDSVLCFFAKITKPNGGAPADIDHFVLEGFDQRRHDPCRVPVSLLQETNRDNPVFLF